MDPELDPQSDVLTVAAMGAADRYAIAHGRSGAALMDAAGAGLAEAVMTRWSRRSVAVLCGPGNNGGDGWEAAVRLREHGWPVEVFSLGARDALKGDAARAAGRWTGPVSPLDQCRPDRFALVVDALFGAGLSRPLDGEPARLAEACAQQRRSGLVVVSADAPSGVDGDLARPIGPAFTADLTVTFHRLKPVHLLQPGRSLCGAVVLRDIGVPAGWREAARPCAAINSPALWPSAPGAPGPGDHKHTRGRLCVVSGPFGASGAARLSAAAGLVSGAGFVTLLCPADALAECAASTRSVVTRALHEPPDFADELTSHRAEAVVLGPGGKADDALRMRVLAALDRAAPTVLDADALVAFSDDANALFQAVSGLAVMTPHSGEFARLFPDLAARDDLNKIEQTRQAAARAGAVVVHKGPDTVIAAPDGRVRVNVHASPQLATAGTGDVLAGVIGGFLAQKASPFDAASAAVWVHGDAGRRCVPGATVETVLAKLPAALAAREDARRRMAALQRIMTARG